MERWNWKAFISLLVVASQTISVLPAVSEGGSITRFSNDSSTADALLAAGGNVTFANISIPVNSLLISGSVKISPLAVQGFHPMEPSLDLGADGTTDWAFNGTGYGAFGQQALFSDGSARQEFNFSGPGTVRCNITLPKNATVENAGLELTGTAGQKWWNTSWHNRLPLKISELAGRNQTDFVVETLLDTRNWTLGGAEKEFRVTLLNDTTLNETEVPLQVMDEINNGSKCFEAALLFAVSSLTAGSDRTYFLYYNNSGAAKSTMFSDFKPRIIRNRLTTQTAEKSFLGPLLGPGSSCFDAYGNFWVADPIRHCVFGYTGQFGVPDTEGSDDSHFWNPCDVVVTPNGRIAICDIGNVRVQVYEPNGSLAFTLGVTGAPGVDNSHFTAPLGLGTDNDGNIYVSDSAPASPRIQVFDPNGSYLATIGGQAGAGNYQFANPTGLFVSPSKDIIVADSGNARVQAFRWISQTNWVYNFTIGVTGQPGSDNAHFIMPHDVAMDPSGRIYIADDGNARVQVFSGTTYVNTIGVTMMQGRDNSHLNLPTGIAVSPNGLIYISDVIPAGTIGSRVQVYDSSFEYVRSLGDRHWTGLLSPGSSNAAFDTPHGVAADASGRIYVSDTNNQRVQVYSALGSPVLTLGVTGVPGSDSRHFNFPRGLDIAPDGKVLVADGGIYQFPVVNSNLRVLVFDDLNDSAADKVLGASGFGNNMTCLNAPWDVAAGANGLVAVADTGYSIPIFPNPPTFGQRVQIYNDLSDATADDTDGVAGTSGNDNTHLSWPDGVGISDTGWIYVADTGNNRVARFKNDDGSPHQADLVLNPSGGTGTGPNQFNRPIDVSLDSKGNIYVADMGNHRIQVFNQYGIYQSTIGETGVNLSDAFHLNNPTGVEVGADGKVYIADSLNCRVMRITPASLSAGAPEELSVPEDVEVDVGADGSIEWSLSGVLEGLHGIDGLAGPLNALLSNLTGTPDRYGNPMVTVPVDIIDRGTGLISLRVDAIDYGCLLELSNAAAAVEPFIKNQSHARANATVPVSYRAVTPGGIRLSGLNITGDFAPVLVSPVPDLALDEDAANRSLCNLSDHFRDDLDSVLNFTLENVSNSSTAEVRLVNGSMLSVDCTVAAARDWNGRITIVASAADSRGLSTLSNAFNVTVRPVNDPPVITSSPPLAARAGELWTYKVNATDAENGTLSFFLDRRPSGMTIEPASGLASWTPAPGQEGRQEAAVRVSDGALCATQSFVVNVSRSPAANHPPRITSAPVTAAEAGKRYVYALAAADEDNDTLSFSLDRCPAGMAIANSTGVIEWTPSQAQKGIHEVVAAVSDGLGRGAQAFNITVVSNLSELAPVLRITGPLPNAKVSGKLWLKGTAAAAGGSNITSVEVSTDSRASWQPAAGKISWMFQLDTTKLSNGLHRIFVRARDAALREAEANITLDVQNAAAPSAGILGLDLWIWALLVVIICAAAGGGAYALSRRKKAAPPVAAAPLLSSSAAQASPAAALVTPAQPPPLPRLAAKPAVPPVKPVDSVFLIYHDGRLITYFSRSESMKLDDTLDMIRRFVKASFSGQLGRLDAMSYENMNIIMERGNLMYMVVITPMSTYDDLRREMRHLLTDIDNRYRLVFKIWDGDFGKVKGVKSMVERFAGEEVWEVEDEPLPPRPEAAPRKQRPAGAPRIPIHPLSASPPPAAPMASTPSQPAPSLPPPSPPSPAPPPPITAPPPPRPQSAPQLPPPAAAAQAPALQPVPPPETPPSPPPQPAPSLPLPPPPPSPPQPVPSLPLPPPPPPQTSPPPQPSPQPPSPPPPQTPPGKTTEFARAGEKKPDIPPDNIWEEEDAPPPKAQPDKEQIDNQQQLAMLEDRFLLGEITEADYRELKAKYSKRK